MINERRVNLVKQEIDPGTKDIPKLKKEEQMKNSIEKIGTGNDISLKVSENKKKSKKNRKKRPRIYQMTDEEFEIWLEMVSLARKYFRDMRVFYSTDTHPDWDYVFREYKVRLWKQPRNGNQSIALVSNRTKTIWIRKNREEDELLHSLLHEISHIYCGFIPKITAQYMTADFYANKIRHNKFLKAVLVLEALANNPLLDEPYCHDLSFKKLENLKIEKLTHSSLFILKSLDLDETLNLQPGTIYGYGRVELFEALRKAVDPNYMREKLRERLMRSQNFQNMIQNVPLQIEWEKAYLDDDVYLEADLASKQPFREYI